MPIYTVHEPAPRAEDVAGDPARFVFVRDGFHFWAFLFGPLWMLWRRLWLVLVLYLIVLAALQVGLWLVEASGPVSAAADLLLMILTGLEAGTLRRWTLSRHRWRTVGVVVADDAELAERRFFDSWQGQPPQRDAPPHTPANGPVLRPPYGSDRAEPAVLGLFPQPGVQR